MASYRKASLHFDMLMLKSVCVFVINCLNGAKAILSFKTGHRTYHNDLLMVCDSGILYWVTASSFVDAI